MWDLTLSNSKFLDFNQITYNLVQIYCIKLGRLVKHSSRNIWGCGRLWTTVQGVKALPRNVSPSLIKWLCSNSSNDEWKCIYLIVRFKGEKKKLLVTSDYEKSDDLLEFMQRLNYIFHFSPSLTRNPSNHSYSLHNSLPNPFSQTYSKINTNKKTLPEWPSMKSNISSIFFGN